MNSQAKETLKLKIYKPPYSESEYKCQFFSSSFELKLNMSFSLGGIKSSRFHVRATVALLKGKSVRVACLELNT